MPWTAFSILSGVPSQAKSNATPARMSPHRRKEAGDNDVLYRGASTSTVPNRVCSRRCRRSFTGWKVRQSGQTLRSADIRPSVREPSPAATWQAAISPLPGMPDVVRRGRQHRTGDAYHLYGLLLAPARLRLQPDRPFHEPLPRSRSMRITPPNSLPTSQGCPRFLPLSLPAPVETEAVPMPTHQRLGLEDDRSPEQDGKADSLLPTGQTVVGPCVSWCQTSRCRRSRAMPLTRQNPATAISTMPANTPGESRTATRQSSPPQSQCLPSGFRSQLQRSSKPAARPAARSGSAAGPTAG